MYFLLDFENVRSTGLEGAEYLNEHDTVMIFYSDVCKPIIQYRVNQIIKSGCEWKIIRLKQVGKNALDYYIATCAGEIFGQNKLSTVAIISNDKGYSAVCDYWRTKLQYPNQIVLKSNLGAAISSAYGQEQRKLSVCKDMSLTNIETEYAKYMEDKYIKEQLIECFGDGAYEAMIPEIIKIINSEHTPRNKYLASLSKFGIKDGVNIYNKIKLMQFNHELNPNSIKSAV